MAKPKSPWVLTREKWPTRADFRRGIVAAALGSNGKYWLQDLQMQGAGTFAMCNFGSTPQYWTHLDSIAPASAASDEGKHD